MEKFHITEKPPNVQKFDTRDDFLDALTEIIMKREEKGQKQFGVTVDDTEQPD